MELKIKALNRGASAFGRSAVKGKRFYVIYKGKRINFGSSTGKTFFDHRDKKKKNAWRARHSKIKNKKGEYVIRLPTSASYWASTLLW